MIKDYCVQLISKRIFLLCMILLVLMDIEAQDRHFSDFTMAPTAINPALTGAFRGTYRINGIYRDQWRKVSSSNPYQTFVGSVDFNIKGNLLLDNDWLSGGLSFSTDKTGSLGFKQNLLGTNLGYHLASDSDYKNVISVGVSFGRLSSSFGLPPLFTTDLLNADTQIEVGGAGYPTDCGAFPGCSSSQNNNMQRGSSDLSLGLTYKTEMESGAVMRLGVSYLHLNGPEQTVAQASGARDSIPIPGEPRRGDSFRRNFVVFGQASTLLSNRVRMNPAFLVMQSSGTTQIQLQSTFDYLVNAKDQFSLTGGLGVRPLPNFDAAYLMAGVKMRDLTVRVTYDITLSSFQQSRTGGSFELSVGYIGRIYRDPRVDKVIFCPLL